MARYQRVARTLNYRAELLNDRNQDFCDGWDPCIGPGDPSAALLQRVLDGRKPMGQAVWLLYTAERDNVDSWAGMKYASYHRTIERVAASGLPFHVGELTPFDHGVFRASVSVARRGTFNDLFDLELIAEDYACVFPELRAKLKRALAAIGGRALFDVVTPAAPPGVDSWDRVPTPVLDLALGYPIENTLALLHKSSDEKIGLYCALRASGCARGL